MRVLVIGGGGREHALIDALLRSPQRPQIFCAPGNAGIASVATLVDIAPTDVTALLQFAKNEKIDLTIVGPERPLEVGVVDAFEEAGLLIVGPRKAAAQLESSKAFAKEILVAAGVDTARAAVAKSVDEARLLLKDFSYPLVIKADGLAEGKGVIIAPDSAAAHSALEELMVKGRLGGAGSTVLLEEFMVGKEASLIALVDGECIKALPPSSDYKRVGDGDTGPNTGGMGTLSPTPVLSDERAAAVAEEIMGPVLNELKRRGIHYRGFLYAGLMVDGERVRVVEFNCRLGDPETQVIIPRVTSDLLGHLLALAQGDLKSQTLEISDTAAVCVVLCSGGYPGPVDDGKIIQGSLSEGEKLDLGKASGTTVYHAGTRLSDDGKIISRGGRILGVTGIGPNTEKAREAVYSRLETVSFDGMIFRRDIAAFHKGA